MLGLMSVVCFLMPPHAEATPSAHASVIPLKVLVAIMWLLPRIAWVGAPVVDRGLPIHLQARGRRASQNRADQRNQSVTPGRICIAPTLSRVTPKEKRLPRMKEWAMPMVPNIWSPDTSGA